MLENSPGWIPYLGAPENKVLAFVERICNHRSSYRRFHMKRMSRNLLHYLGYQWLSDDPLILGDTSGYFFYRGVDRDTAGDIPTPVTNYTSVACDNEHARIGKKAWTFKVLADKGTPRIRAAAQLAQDILRSKLDRQNWEDKRDVSIMDAIITGTTALMSRFDLSIVQEMVAPVDAAKICSQCGEIISSETLPVEYKSRIVQTDAIQDVSEETLSVKACPFCGGALQSIDLTPDQAEFGADAFDRPLGIRVPKGDPVIDVISPFELFPENGGLFTELQGLRSLGWMRPVDLYWLLERYPNSPVINELEPDNAAELSKLHPIFGEYGAGQTYSSVVEQGILDNHVMLSEVVVRPFAERITEESARAAAEQGLELKGSIGEVIVNDGRYYLCAGNKVIEQSPLHVEYEDHAGKLRKMPKVLIGVARHRVRRGEFWGNGIPDDTYSLQQRINSIDGQHIETITRLGSPNLVAADDLDVRGPEWRDDVGPAGGRILTFTRSVTAPTDRPEIVEGRAQPAVVWAIRDRWLQDIQIVGNITDAELGDVPPNLRTTSGLVLVGENAAARRNSRERALAAMYEPIAKHQLQLLYSLRSEKDTYEIDAKGASATAIKSFRGSDILAQYNVKIDKEAGVDPEIYIREATFEALQAGLYPSVMTNPVARKRVLKQAGLPEVEDLDNCQVTLAEQVTFDFVERGIVHRPEYTIEDPSVFFQVLGQFWLQNDKVRLMKEQADWNDGILPLLADWERDLLDLEARAAASDAYYGRFNQAIPPEQAEQLFQEAVAQEQAVMQQYQVAVAEAQKSGVAPPLAPQVQVPPQPVYLPHALEERVMLVWNERLGLPTEPSPESEPDEVAGVVDQLLQFASVIEAYRLYAERRQLQAAMGPVMAAPGSASAPGGIEPSPGAPAVQGAPPIPSGGM
jgi:hypothetical protein